MANGPVGFGLRARPLCAGTRRSAWAVLGVATAASLAGNVWHAYRVTSGSVAAMLAAAVVPVLLLLGMHLTGGMAAARREGRVHAAAHRVAVAGIAVLVLMVLAASFFALRDLLLLERFHPVAATLIPLSVDVAVVVSTASLFTLTPRLRRGRSARSAAEPTPAKPRSTAAPTSSTTAAAADLSASAPAAVTVAVAAEAQLGPVLPHGDEAVEVTQEHLDRAVALLQQGVVAKPVEELAEVLALLAAGLSERRTSAITGWSTNTIAKVRKAGSIAPALTAV